MNTKTTKDKGLIEGEDANKSQTNTDDPTRGAAARIVADDTDAATHVVTNLSKDGIRGFETDAGGTNNIGPEGEAEVTLSESDVKRLRRYKDTFRIETLEEAGKRREREAKERGKAEAAAAE